MSQFVAILHVLFTVLLQHYVDYCCWTFFVKDSGLNFFSVANVCLEMESANMN